MATKDELIGKYKEYKERHKAPPSFEEFYKFAGITRRALSVLYGRGAYTKFQIDCGDEANKLSMERTPREKIMRQYGDLALKLGELPNSSDWIFYALKPSLAGLSQKPHLIPWTDFPEQFSEWAKDEGISGYEKVLELIAGSSSKVALKSEKRDRAFEKLGADIRAWSPGRRRNSEGEYKVELKAHLKSIGYAVNEEYGESNIDLLINKKYMVELKKGPNLGDYDRLFGQLARHLQHQLRVIALIFDVPSDDNFNNFASLLDLYLNRAEKTIELIKK